MSNQSTSNSRPEPILSVVVMARNDNYGGNWINRINAFLKVWGYFADLYKKSIEIILVEYNPIKDKPFLHKELAVPHTDFLTFRTIIVPESFHQALPDHDKVPICEFIAKNIGIRRAAADYILAMNPDIVISEELFEYITSNKLDTEHFYRVNRYDTSCNYIDPALSAQEVLSYVRKHVTRVLYNFQTKYISWSDWFHTFIHGRTLKILLKIPLLNTFHTFSKGDEVINENAAGDFLLAHRSAWNTIGGYDERTVGSGVLDGYVMYMLYCCSYTQKLIDYPIYHLYHDHKGVKYLASHQQFRKDAEEMLQTKRPYKEVKKDWGFPTLTFKEVIQP